MSLRRAARAVQKEMHDRLYFDIDRTWARLNWFHSGYMSFELIYNFLAARIVAYGPGLVPYMNEKIRPEGLHNRRRTGQFADQPMLLVHPGHAGDRDAEGQCPARERSRQRDRKRPAADGILPQHRPLRFPLRQPARGVRAGRPRSRTDASGRRCSAFRDGRKSALPAAASGPS